MGILNYLPTFKQIEPDNLLGLTMGYVLAQRPVQYSAEGDTYGVDVVDFGGHKFIENGIICALDADGKVVKAAGTEDQLFIHFTEELNTVIPGRKYFAVEGDKDETYLRLVALVPGSEWTTNQTYEGLDARIKDLGATTLPNGEAAHKYLFIK